MKKNIISKIIYRFCLILTLFLFTACESDTSWDTSQRGNSDGNLANLGLTATDGDTLYLIGTSSPHDLIYEADEEGNPQKAITGLTGYIQFLNIQNDAFYFLGITYDSEENRSEGIFSADLDGENQNCLYNIESGSTVTYLAAVGDLLICAVENEEGKTDVRALYPAENSEARLFSENHTVRSLLINEGKCYYIMENKIICRDLDGNNRTTLLRSDQWIGNMITDGAALYYTKSTEHGDVIEKSDLNGENTVTLFENSSYISHMNLTGNTLCFADDQRDSENELIQSTLRTINTETAETENIATVKEDYIGLSIIDDLLICHMNDDALTAKIFELN